jgi:hypothetical protein
MKPQLPYALAAIATLSVAACAPAIEPIRVRASELAKMPAPVAPNQPVIVEFAEGDVIPIDLSFSGDLLELTPASPGLAFRAKRRFFVRIAPGRLEVSTDGVHFGERPKVPGSFRLGLAIKSSGARVEADLKMPKHVSATEARTD